MKILARDAEVLRVISRFSMLTSKQIQAVVFRENVTPSGFKKSIGRLIADNLVVRIERRVPGGANGGSGQYVYRLSSTGWRMLHANQAYKVRRTVDYHALEIASAYIRCLDAVDDGWLRIHHAEVEAEAMRIVGGEEWRPDLYVELDNLTTGKRRPWAIEVDMGTENRAVIYENIKRYDRAAEHGTGAFPKFPQVLYLVPDVARRQQLQRWIGEVYDNTDKLFAVELLEDFPNLLK